MRVKGRFRVVAAFLIAAMYFSCLPVTDAYALTTQEKLNQAQQSHQETTSKLNETKDNLNSLNEVKSSLQGKLEDLNTELTNVSNNLEDLEEKISDKENEIEQTQKDLDKAKETEKWQYECMKKRIQFMYEKKDYVYTEMLFASGSFSDFINKNNYIEQLSEYDRKMLTEYQETRKSIEEKEAEIGFLLFVSVPANGVDGKGYLPIL